MKKVVFVGLSNKKDKEPFDKTTNSGKIINEVINYLDCECFKLNQYNMLQPINLVN